MNSSIVTNTTVSPTQLVRISPEILLVKLFDKYDVDKDGRLSKFQFAKIMQYLSKITGAIFPKKQDINDLFMNLDMDGDQSINRTEYNRLMVSVVEIFQAEDITIKFRKKN